MNEPILDAAIEESAAPAADNFRRIDSFTPAELRHRGISPFVVKCLNKFIPARPMAVLDAPCGFGRHSTLLADLGHEVTCVDIDASRVNSFCDHGDATSAGCCGIVHDLGIYRAGWRDQFDVVLVVDFWSAQFAQLLHRYIKSGGYLLLETMGNRGANWRELPKPSVTMQFLEPHFDVLFSKIDLVGPTKAEAETSKIIARRK